MEKTPVANRTHIAIYGNRNAGKSTLFNAILGQDIAVVSSFAGTTTDPVFKSMELLDFGPVVWIDTAGLDDEGLVGDLRVKKTHQMLQRTDFALYLIDGERADYASYVEMMQAFKKFNIPHLTLCHVRGEQSRESCRETLGELHFPEDIFFMNAHKLEEVHELLDRLKKDLNRLDEEPSLLAGVLPYGSTVVLVVPIDSEAPKGRLILPQVQLLRDALDHGIACHVVRDTELEMTLKNLKKVDLVITDSQAFKEVEAILPPHMPLTSFSILFARQKGDLNVFINGIKKIDALNEKSKILISESCTHNHSHEDIGRVKIPKLLKQNISHELDIDFSMGHDFPENIQHYDLVIHCGACMMNRKSMQNRLQLAQTNQVAITNYGLLLAYYTGILTRSVEAFQTLEERRNHETL